MRVVGLLVFTIIFYGNVVHEKRKFINRPHLESANMLSRINKNHHVSIKLTGLIKNSAGTKKMTNSRH